MHYVMSDIHGDLVKFHRMLDIIQFSDEDTLFILGDAIDRGRFSFELLAEIMSDDHMVFIRGNHEKMFMDYFDVCIEQLKKGYIDKDLPVLWQMSYSSEFVCELWMANGGRASVQDSRKFTFNQLQVFYDFLKGTILHKEIEVGDKKYYLVHGKPSVEYIEDEMIWGQVEPEEHFFDDKILVFGHTPTAHYQDDAPMSIWVTEDKIGVDCGCGWQKSGGRLGCLCLETMEEFYVNPDN